MHKFGIWYVILCLCYVAALEEIDVFPTEVCDMANWMQQLHPYLKQLPLVYLAIPGSHNTMSYGINSESELAPDFPDFLSPLWSVIKGSVLGWVKTQVLNVTQQLNIGIRYFDIRLATKHGTDKLYFTHGLYADEISGPLREIRTFLDSHPGEVVILDFQHFHNFTNAAHYNLIENLIKVIFIDKICWKEYDVKVLTLKLLTKTQETVIIVYRDHYRGSYRLWTGYHWRTDWPDTDDIDYLPHFLHEVTEGRNPNTGIVHQAILTFRLSTLTTCHSDILNCFAKPIQQKVIPNLLKLSPGRPPAGQLNVVIADYVDLSPGNNELFPKAIVQLNYKLINISDYEL